MSCNRITVNQLREALQSRQACQVLDVREPADFAEEHIGLSENIPLTRLKERLSCVSKVVPVYLVCKSGRLAYQAASLLAGYQFDNVFVVAGGLLAWSSQAFPVVREKRLV